MSPSNPCKVKVSLQHLDLYIKDLNHNSIVFISLLLGDKLPSMKKTAFFWNFNVLSFTQNAKIV